MRILSYEARGSAESNLHFPKINFGKLNLIVGDSGTGKTRLLNTIFNGARLVTRKAEFYVGLWDMTFEEGGKIYRWCIETGGDEGEESIVISERILMIEDSDEKVIISRNTDSFVFDGTDLPKLSPRESSISLLQDEELIQPLHRGLSSIMRRNFSGPDLEVAAAYQAVPQNFLRKIQKTKDLNDLFSSGLNLSGKLYILSLHFSDIYERICSEFKAIFPFVSRVKLFDAEEFGFHHPGMVPVFALREKDIDVWVPLKEFSSGMRKVLLILTDIFVLPTDGGVYLLDEYENSLGINAINFFPSVLLGIDTPSQFIVTSHHPYIIGNVPVKNWIVLHRKGTEVLVKQGKELEDRFDKSKQQSFVQLINDPFYVEGVE
jgi:AAA15 family ATPase/GTPase